jgi:hypothetical protein
MAPFVGFVTGLLASASLTIAATGLVGLATATLIVNIGASLIGLALLGKLAEKLVDIPDLNETAKNNLVTTRGTLEHQRIIYGEILVSGPLWYMNAAGTNNQALYHAVVVAGHEIEDITDVWFDDNVILDSSIDWSGDGSVDTGWPGGGTTYLQKFLGTDVQSASGELIAGFTEINSQHQGRGIAYLLTRTDYLEDQTNVWSAGLPANFRALVKGKKVYNPSSDSTQAFGTGPHRVDSSPTWEYSNNPALCWADYMIDSKLGFGEDPSRINYGYVASAAGVNSTFVATPNSASTTRFECNGTLSTGTTHRGNLESILSSANMTMALVQGVWKLRPFAYEAPTLMFTDDDLRGDIQISLSTEETKRYNTVRASFIDKARKYQPHPAPAFTASEYIARDNDEVLFKDIQLPMTTDVNMAQRLAAGILEQGDQQTTVLYPSNFKTLPVEIGGTIMLSNEKMNWDNKVFRVNNYKFSDMKGIDLVLQEDSASAYTDVATTEYSVLESGVYTTNDPGVPAPTNFAISNGPEGIALTWNPPSARLYDLTEIWRNTVNSFDNANLNYLSRTDNYTDSPLSQGQYYYWLRARNFAGEVSSRIPTGDGLSGLFIAETTLTSDPTFELQGLGQSATTADNIFWSDIRTSGDYSISINSDGTNATETPFLHFRGVKTADTTIIRDLKNKKWSPIVPGMKINMWLQYRVPTYTNLSSSYLLFTVDAWKNFGSLADGLAGSPLGVGSRSIGITNSIGWTVFSETLDYSDLTLTSSYTIISPALRFYGRSVTNTGTLEIDVDKVFLNYTS